MRGRLYKVNVNVWLYKVKKKMHLNRKYHINLSLRMAIIKPNTCNNWKYIFATGTDYGHQTLNPSNQCQWCDLYDSTARANSVWSDRPAVACDDQDACTKKDTCDAGRYVRVSACTRGSLVVYYLNSVFCLVLSSCKSEMTQKSYIIGSEQLQPA